MRATAEARDLGGTAEIRDLDGKVGVPPLAAGVLHRRRLTALLERATVRRATVVIAPAGAGKTVACAAWAAASGRRIAWLTVDETHNDPARFWYCMSAALTSASLGDHGAVPAPRPATIGGPVTMVLDNMHELVDVHVLDGIDLLLQHGPSGLHMVFSGRRKPALPGLEGQLDSADLACTQAEADAYFAQLGLNAAPADRDALLACTGGWMTAMHLAALAAARRRDRRVTLADYRALTHDMLLAELRRQPPPDPGSGLRSPLTASELAVLRLLPGYLTNQEIAAKLFLSVNTVKSHLKSAYHKMGVTSRRAAVAHARRLQLL